jgi:hypothetical protein
MEQPFVENCILCDIPLDDEEQKVYFCSRCEIALLQEILVTHREGEEGY